MRKEFLMERQGKSFALYAGILDMAHQQGLKSIHTAIIQAPTEANNRVAIVTATVILERDGRELTFTGIADAAPNNVAPAMQTMLLRMAETRAKARALRDAVNVGVAAFEELGEEGAHDDAPETGYAPRANRSTRQATPPAQARAPKPETNPNGPATPVQIGAIRSLCDRQQRDADKFAKVETGIDLENLSQGQAADLIRKLNAPAARTAA